MNPGLDSPPLTDLEVDRFDQLLGTTVVFGFCRQLGPVFANAGESVPARARPGRQGFGEYRNYNRPFSPIPAVSGAVSA